MTYQISKHPTFNIKHRALSIDRQAGVTLLLAVLVLSSILAISFSLATILFIEIRTSGDLLRTEPAYYAASGVGEEAIFNVAREVCANSSDCAYTSRFNNAVTIAAPQQSSTTTPLFQDIVPSADHSFSSPKSYMFYNPSNPNSTGSGYGKVSLTYLNSGNQDPLDVYMCQFDASGQTVYNSTPCSDPNDTSTPPYWLSAYTMDPAAHNTQTWTLDPSKAQQLILYNGSTNSTANIFVSIETYASDGVTPLGLPYNGQTAVQIDASNADVARKIRVIIPNSGGPSVSGSPPSITFDSAAHSIGAFTSSLTWSHTVGSGSNGILLVGVGTYYNDDCSSVTFDGQSLTKQITSPTSGLDHQAVYYLLNPPSGTFNVVANCSHSGGNEYVMGGSISFFGVSQTSPFDNQASGTDPGGATATNSLTPIASNTYLADFMYWGNGVTSITPSFTDAWAVTDPGNGQADAGSYTGPVSSPGPQNDTWTWATSFAPSAYVIVSLNP